MTSMPPAEPTQPPDGFGQVMARFARFCVKQPLAVALFAALFVTLGYFYNLALFMNETRSAALWAWEAWNPETNQEHSVLSCRLSYF
jgi:hypothetical protein